MTDLYIVGAMLVIALGCLLAWLGIYWYEHLTTLREWAEDTLPRDVEPFPSHEELERRSLERMLMTQAKSPVKGFERMSGVVKENQ